MNKDKLCDDFSFCDDHIKNIMKLPVCLCLDVSSSMKNFISELEDGVKKFYDSLKTDEYVRVSCECEIAIVTFDSKVKVLEDFSLVDTKQKPHLTTSSGTNIVDGVLTSLSILYNKRREYAENNLYYHLPWLVIMSDGKINDCNGLEYVQRMVRSKEDRLTVFVVGIGTDVDMKVLNGFSRRGALHIKKYNFEEFFEWRGEDLCLEIQEDELEHKTDHDTVSMDEWSSID